MCMSYRSASGTVERTRALVALCFFLTACGRRPLPRFHVLLQYVAQGVLNLRSLEAHLADQGTS